MLRWFKWVLVLAALAAAPAQAATLEIVVGNVRDIRGKVLISVCIPQRFLAEFCEFNGQSVAHPGEVIVTIQDVPPGTYAVQAFLDDDGDERIRRNWLGIPQEGIGFSNDAPFRFGPPSFGDAAFILGPAGGRIRLNLRYFD